MRERVFARPCARPIARLASASSCAEPVCPVSASCSGAALEIAAVLECRRRARAARRPRPASPRVRSAFRCTVFQDLPVASGTLVKSLGFSLVAILITRPGHLVDRRDLLGRRSCVAPPAAVPWRGSRDGRERVFRPGEAARPSRRRIHGLGQREHLTSRCSAGSPGEGFLTLSVGPHEPERVDAAAVEPGGVRRAGHAPVVRPRSSRIRGIARAPAKAWSLIQPALPRGGGSVRILREPRRTHDRTLEGEAYDSLRHHARASSTFRTGVFQLWVPSGARSVSISVTYSGARITSGCRPPKAGMTPDAGTSRSRQNPAAPMVE